MNVSNPKIGRTPSGQFQKGVSGNPAGRPKGARNRATVLREAFA